MGREKPSYWAVLPASVRYDPALPPNAKLLYAEISSLADRAGYPTSHLTLTYFPPEHSRLKR